MTDRPTNRPIRRRAKMRDEKIGQSPTLSQEGSGDAIADQPAPSPEPEPLSTTTDSPARQGTMRRVYEPGGPSSPSQTRASRAVAPARRVEVNDATKKNANPKKPGKRPLSKEQQRAKKLAREKGIPPLHALRVVRGEVGINDVLKSLVRKEKTARLIAQDGLDRDLAGQVASGHLRLERAHELQRIRRFRVHRIDRDVIHIAAKDQGEIAFQAFGGAWLRGVVTESRIYEFDFIPQGQSPSESILIQKHDVKTVCAGEHLDRVLEQAATQASIVEENLAGTSDPKERVRPKDATMLALIEGQTPSKCILRDGITYHGQIVSFGRWDLDLKLQASTVITIFFHALHEATPWLD